MDSYELNKIAGAVLGTLTFVLGLSIFSEVIFTPAKPAIPGYDLPGAPEGGPAAAGGAPQEQSEPLPVLLAKADQKRGETAARKCAACHSFESGGPNKVGPNLYGVVGRNLASHPGFNYSAALKAKGGEWSFEQLDAFLRNPRQAVPGTTMAFAGVSRAEERADIIAYMRSLSDNPVPLPAAEAAAQPAAGAPADGAQAPAKQ